MTLYSVRRNLAPRGDYLLIKELGCARDHFQGVYAEYFSDR